MVLLLMLGVLAAPEGVAAAPWLCRGRPATIVGSPGDDHLVGTAGPDVIAGYSSTKETANAVTWGHTFLWEWTEAGG